MCCKENIQNTNTYIISDKKCQSGGWFVLEEGHDGGEACVWADKTTLEGGDGKEDIDF